MHNFNEHVTNSDYDFTKWCVMNRINLKSSSTSLCKESSWDLVNKSIEIKKLDPKLKVKTIFFKFGSFIVSSKYYNC